MPRGRDARSSDIDRARQLTRRFEDGKATAEIEQPGYIRFDAARFGAPPARPTPPPPPPPLPPPQAHVDWDALLGWVRARVNADTVLLTDAQGLLVGLSGDASRAHAEVIGSCLVLSFEHANRMEADDRSSRFIVVEFGGVIVSGMRIELPEGGGLVLGIASSTAIDVDARAEIERALAEKVRQT